MANGRLKTASFGPAFLGALVLFLAFAVVAWILFRFGAPAPTYEEKRAQERRDKVAAINSEAEKKLYGGVAWIDPAKKTVQLPIDIAMDLVVRDYQAKMVQPSQVKVEVPYPAGLQMAAAAPAAGLAVAPGTLPKPAPGNSLAATPAAKATPAAITAPPTSVAPPPGAPAPAASATPAPSPAGTIMTPAAAALPNPGPAAPAPGAPPSMPASQNTSPPAASPSPEVKQ